ncbi:MAG TPA: FHA domain-containing serine/threonine-protein kinase [Ktedonobacteraceae bacterium]|nr:FHA domain-containing serine/threonine-protein kinase [Ktedonobacteraceae bacterium]
MANDLLGRQIKGRYKLIDERGSGNFGTVYIARDNQTNYLYAAKIMRIDLIDDNELVERFKREAVILYNLNDIHIVRVIDYGNEGSLYYIIMHHIDGQNLKYYTTQYGPMEPLRALDYIHQSAEGLNAAYMRGIVHRDIKPQNILVSNKGVVKIADFGLSRSRDMLTITQSDRFMGTAYYVAPEQVISSHEVDTRADLYALSAVFFEILTGQPPYTNGSALDIILKHTRDPIPSVCRLRPDLPADLDSFFQKALAKPPVDRFQSPSEFIQAIEQLQTRLRSARPISRPSASLPEKQSDLLDKPTSIPEKQPDLPERPASSPEKQACLVLLEGNRIYPLRGVKMLVGREDPRREIHPDILIDDPSKSVGRIHACITCQQGLWNIEDRNSRNKTRVNGEVLTPYEPRQLKDGDLLRFGRVEARFELR